MPSCSRHAPPALRCGLIEGAMKKGRSKTATLSYGAYRVERDSHVTLVVRLTVARDLVGPLDGRTVPRGSSRSTPTGEYLPHIMAAHRESKAWNQVILVTEY